jgi:hypothetical protein
MTLFTEVFKRHKQKLVQKFKIFKNHCENYQRKQTKHQNLQKYFVLQSYSFGSPVKHIVDPRMLSFQV